MDIHMPRCSGVEAAKKIRELGIDSHIIALSMFPKKRFVIEMLEAGAKGYILKDCAFEELVKAICQVMEGKLFLSQDVSMLVVEDYLEKKEAPLQKSRLDSLTPREREVLKRIAEGQSSRTIGQELNCSPKTVDVHRFRIMQKLELGSVAELVKYALSKGLTSI